MSLPSLGFSEALDKAAGTLARVTNRAREPGLATDPRYAEWMRRHRFGDPITVGSGAQFMWNRAWVRRGDLVLEFNVDGYSGRWALYLVRPRDGAVEVVRRSFDEAGSDYFLEPKKPSFFSFSRPAEIRVGGYSRYSGTDLSAPWWPAVEAQVPGLVEAAREFNELCEDVRRAQLRQAREDEENRRREQRDWYHRG